jgi:hypothetical protein
VHKKKEKRQKLTSHRSASTALLAAIQWPFVQATHAVVVIEEQEHGQDLFHPHTKFRAPKRIVSVQFSSQPSVPLFHKTLSACIQGPQLNLQHATPPVSTMTYALAARQAIPQVVKAANPQGGMADPNSVSPHPETKIISASAMASEIPTELGLAEQLAGLDIREKAENNLGSEYRVLGRPINQVKIPAHQHDERKLFVGGLPTHGALTMLSLQRFFLPISSFSLKNLSTMKSLVSISVTEAEFLQFFEQFGEVIDSVVMIDRVTRRSRGFGFVTFAQHVRTGLLHSILYFLHIIRVILTNP